MKVLTKELQGLRSKEIKRETLTSQEQLRVEELRKIIYFDNR